MAYTRPDAVDATTYHIPSTDLRAECRITYPVDGICYTSRRTKKLGTT